MLAVRTGGEGHKGISLVLFPTKTKGFSVGKKLKKIGNLASDTAELFFDECRLPEERAKVALQLKHLVTPAGLGETFHVLVASKGVDAASVDELSGLRFGRRQA